MDPHDLSRAASGLRYNFIPDHLIGEILTKRWTDNAIPFLALVVTVAVFGTAIPGFFRPLSLQESTRQLGEFAIVVTGLTVVMLAAASTCRSARSSRSSAFAAVATFFIFGSAGLGRLLAAIATGAVFGASTAT